MKFNLLANTLSTLAIAAVASASLSGHAQAATFAGNSSGTWGTPTPGDNPTPVYTGVGSNTFTWGDGFGTGPNRLSFTGTSISSDIDSLFKVGDLTYFNGTTIGGTAVDSVPLDVNLAFTSPSSFSQSFGFNFKLVSTPNLGVDPDADADFVFPTNSFGSSSFSFGGTDYTLQLTGFSKDGGLTTVNEFHVREGATDTAAVYGKITAAPKPAAVPEPGAMAGLGLLGIYFVARRQGQRAKAMSLSK